MRLINADALKSALEIEHYNDYDDLLRTERLIDNAPPIKTFTLADIDEQYRKGLEKGMEEAERPYGEWISKAVHNCWTRFECSVCGYYHQPVHDFGESKPDFNFCPNCGASMVKKEGEAE